MKQIKAILQPFLLENLLALDALPELPGLTVSQVLGWGRERGAAQGGGGAGGGCAPNRAGHGRRRPGGGVSRRCPAFAAFAALFRIGKLPHKRLNPVRGSAFARAFLLLRPPG